MSLLKRKGFTLIELITVMVILGIIAALIFPVFRSSRGSGHQTTTATNLSQIYKGMLLYGSDYGVSDEVPGLGSVPAMPLERSNVLFSYGIAPAQLHSAAFPQAGRKRWGSSFIYYWVTSFSAEGLKMDAEKNRKRLQEEENAFVIVQDTVHDYFDYWPQEKKSDPLMQKRYEINLRIDGSVKRERRPGIRGTVLPYWL